MKKNKSTMMVLIAILGAWAYLMRLFDFPLLPAAPYLKVDLSDLLVWLGLLINGPVTAFSIALIRDVINYMVKGGEAGIPIGATMSIIASLAFYLPHHIMLKKMHLNQSKTIKIVLIGIVSTVSLTIILSAVNYFVALPLYIKILNFPIPSISEYVWQLTIPFNLMKGVMLTVGEIILITPVVTLLRKRNWLYEVYPLFK